MWEGYRKPENILKRVYTMLAYDFHKSDEEIFNTPMSRVEVLINDWTEMMNKRNEVKK